MSSEPVTETAPQVTVVIEEQRALVIDRVLVWLLFGVVFGLLPLIAVGLGDALTEGGFHLESVLAEGELFIISAVLCAAALGELLASAFRGGPSRLALVAGFSCLLTFAVNTVCFVRVGEHSSPNLVTTWSVTLFLTAVLSSSVSIGLAAAR
jgi:hypothetical protein